MPSSFPWEKSKLFSYSLKENWYESGRLEVKRSQANTYMRVASNYQRAGNFEGVASIRAALELLSDKEPADQQSELAGVAENLLPIGNMEPLHARGTDH